MGELKPGWQRVKFGDVVRQVKDKVDPQTSGLKRYVAGEHMDTDDLRIRRWGDIGDGYLGPAFHIRFKPGHVLYGSRRTYLRKVAVADFEGICANTTFVVESASPNVLLPEILPFIMTMEAFHDHSRRESKGSVNPYVNFSDLAWYEFVLPPIEEQRRILRLLSEADKMIFRHVACVDSAASMQQAFDEDFLEKASRCYPMRPILELSKCYSRRHNASDRIFEVDAATPGAVPVLRSLNVWPGRFDLTDIRYISAAGNAAQAKLRLHEGDLLIVRTGDAGRPGNAAVVSRQMSGWNCLDLVLMRPLPSVHPEFLEAVLNRPSSLQRLTSLAPGTKQKHLTMTDLHRLLIPVPPRQEQNVFVRQRRELLDVVAASVARLGQAQSVRKSFQTILS